MSRSVTFKELFPCPTVQFVDVRSPVEFSQGHIPGAVNIPLFTDDERARIGTIYKQVDQEQALALGEEIARPKVEQIITLIEEMLPADIVIYCWRGGKRSSEVCRLVNEAGVAVKRLHGGYRAYRRGIRSCIEQPRKLCILGGKTGSGKTAILQGLQAQGIQVIDLEALAHHKGSVFGHINEGAQPTTEQFENDFHQELQRLDPENVLLLENESYVIGSVHLPPPLLLQMRAAPLLIIEVPVEARIDRLVQEYSTTDRQELTEACQRIAQKLTRPRFLEIIDCIERDDLRTACEHLLVYYDYYYNRGIEKRKNQEISFLSLSGFALDDDITRVKDTVIIQHAV
ncbi:tRNA 2-selenouridine synthase [Desulfocapsa sulfexigens DSM 10523]|uniref:tRNA 2-selenouridine synthase n=1 Tax=Desulfocapsa sulfexigens (strain DSM 10523 / SB164P1) TaxID=1167006 RepID=M1NGW9_DESSD|nr:tRNA 2-selenouridine(34) synthase MnmH [Desulfocapsa sulfexigens]AGF78869.1 tRNA 2-selenouridine synthase [Desulfocapsa sulfexigens DSM 10523]